MIQETIKETVAVGRTVESAVAAGAKELGADPGSVTYEVLEQPKKGFLGFGEAPAKVKVFYTVSEEDVAVSFVKKILADMEIDAQVSVTADVRARRDRLISITGEEAGALIGHHGETLEALQYLVNLAAGRKDGDGEGDEGHASRYTVDIENYRARREQTLKRLAHRMSEKALKTHHSVALEPMNPYERRIIHAEVQNIAGVTTSSVGSEGNRRVVIYPGDGTSGKGKGRRRKKSGEKANVKAEANVNVEVDVDVDVDMDMEIEAEAED